MHHLLTVDVEEYFQVSAFDSCVERSRWDTLESRVEPSVQRLLYLLERHGAKATFFVLGWVAERHPAIVSRIVRGGHEIASHGWDHRRVTHLTPQEFRTSVRRTKRLLEELSGAPVLGFRAPSFSIVPGREWALDILVEEGYRYDSSLFPVWRAGYGYPGGGRDPYWIPRAMGWLAEFPPSTLRRWWLNLPAAGGAYLRILPYGLVQAALRDHERRRTPGTIYVHPWELDPGQPRMAVSRVARLRHYTGLRQTWSRLNRLLSEFRFTSVAGQWRTDGGRAPAMSGAAVRIP
jgi:polysaccharide deacetylase family protein (PEP-CTERM system associated)